MQLADFASMNFRTHNQFSNIQLRTFITKPSSKSSNSSETSKFALPLTPQVTLEALSRFGCGQIPLHGELVSFANTVSDVRKLC